MAMALPATAGGWPSLYSLQRAASPPLTLRKEGGADGYILGAVSAPACTDRICYPDYQLSKKEVTA